MAVPRMVKITDSHKKQLLAKKSGTKKIVTAGVQAAGSIGKLRQKVSSDIMEGPYQYYDPDLEPDSMILPDWRRSPSVLKRWCEHFYQQDPVVAQCIDMHTQLPLSKLTFRKPKLSPDASEEDHQLAERSKLFFDAMFDHLDIFKLLLNVAFQYWLLGNVFPYGIWDKKKMWWDRFVCLDMDHLIVANVPFTDDFVCEWKVPVNFKEILSQSSSVANGSSSSAEFKSAFDALIAHMPSEIAEAVQGAEDSVVLNTDPSEGQDTVFHLAYMRKNYDAFGIPLVYRILKILYTKDQLIKSQNAIAARNMDPIHLIYGEELGEDDLLDLRQQVEMAMDSPDYCVITNYKVDWDMITGNDRTTDLSRDFEFINEQIMVGLGMNKTLLAGEGTYSNSYISQAIVNERYRAFREVLTDWLEDLCVPVAEAHGLFVTEKLHNGYERKRYLIPDIAWNKTYIIGNRDNLQMMQSMFNDGLIDHDTFLSQFGLDSAEIRKKLKEDTGDGFQLQKEVVRNISSDLGRSLAPYMVDTMLDYLGVDPKVREAVKEEESGGRR